MYLEYLVLNKLLAILARSGFPDRITIASYSSSKLVFSGLIIWYVRYEIIINDIVDIAPINKNNL